MIIKAVELVNFRIYYGNHNIELSPNDENLIIISGKNGFGKTTFLMSIVWCLFGKQMEQVDDLYYKEIQDQGGYSKYISNSLNRLARNKGETSFSVAITFTDVSIPEIPCKEIMIKRTFDIKSASFDEVEIIIDGSQNELTEDVGKEIFIRDFILPKEIAKFFLFDAEKIVSLAEFNSIEQRRKLSKAYSEVLGIHKYEELKTNLEDLRVRLKHQSATPKDKEKLNTVLSGIENLRINVDDIENRIVELKDKKSSLKYDSNQIQEKLIREGQTITLDQLEELRIEEQNLTKVLDELNDELKSSYEIIPFAISGDKLFEIATQIESEVEYKKNKFNEESINELSDNILTDLIEERKNFPEKVHITIHDFYVSSFKKLIRRYFFNNSNESYNDFVILHDFSESEIIEFNTLIANLKSSFYDSFKRMIGDYNQAKNELYAIRRKLKDAEANKEDPIISDFRSKKEAIDKSIFNIETEIEGLLQKIGELKNEIIRYEKNKVALSEKMLVSNQNMEKDLTVKRLLNELTDFIKRFKEKKKESLEKEILLSLNSLMHKEYFKNVVVEMIGEDMDIQLYNIDGEQENKPNLSQGEKQLYATAILMGLVEESEIEFPVFIDSPMQKFDEEHAKNIVKIFYPNISKQVVIFPHSKKELSPEEFNILYSNIAKTFIIKNINLHHSEIIEVEKCDFYNKYEEINSNANTY